MIPAFKRTLITATILLLNTTLNACTSHKYDAIYLLNAGEFIESLVSLELMEAQKISREDEIFCIRVKAYILFRARENSLKKRDAKKTILFSRALIIQIEKLKRLIELNQKNRTEEIEKSIIIYNYILDKLNTWKNIS